MVEQGDMFWNRKKGNILTRIISERTNLLSSTVMKLGTFAISTRLPETYSVGFPLVSLLSSWIVEAIGHIYLGG